MVSRFSPAASPVEFADQIVEEGLQLVCGPARRFGLATGSAPDVKLEPFIAIGAPACARLSEAKPGLTGKGDDPVWQGLPPRLPSRNARGPNRMPTRPPPIDCATNSRAATSGAPPLGLVHAPGPWWQQQRQVGDRLLDGSNSFAWSRIWSAAGGGACALTLASRPAA